MKTAILPLPGQEKANKYHPKQPGGTGEAAVGKPMPGSSRNDFDGYGYFPPDDNKRGGGIFPASCKTAIGLPGSGTSAAHHEGSQTNQAEGCRGRFGNGSRRNGIKIGFLGSISLQRGIIHDKVFDVIRAIGK